MRWETSTATLPSSGPRWRARAASAAISSSRPSPAREARDPRNDPCSAYAGARPGDGGGAVPGRVSRRALRRAHPWHAAVPQGRRVPQSRGDWCRACRQRAPAAAHRDRRDRQPRQGRGGAGDPEHERDARPAGDGGARVLSVRVVKLGGNELDRPEWLAACADALKAVGPVVLVHGGGEAVSAVSRRLDIPVEKHAGRRVTSPEVAEVVEMVLAGPVNRLLVAALRAAGLDALGLSGVDGGLLTARPAAGGLGHVGEIVEVRTSLLHSLLP